MHKIYKIILMIIGVQIAFHGFASENDQRESLGTCLSMLPTILPRIDKEQSMKNFLKDFYSVADQNIKECIHTACSFYNNNSNYYTELTLEKAQQNMREIKEEKNPFTDSIDSLKNGVKDMIFQIILYGKSFSE